MQNHWGIYVFILGAVTLSGAGVLMMLALRELQAETRRMRDLWGSEAEEKLTTAMAHRKRVIEARGETADQIIDRLVERQVSSYPTVNDIAPTVHDIVLGTVCTGCDSQRCSKALSK